MQIASNVELPIAAIADICRRHEVRQLSLFGSAARGEMRADSDLDFLVDFLPQSRTSLPGFIGMQNELSDLLGRRVDLASRPALKARIRDSVLAEARPIYEA